MEDLLKVRFYEPASSMIRNWFFYFKGENIMKKKTKNMEGKMMLTKVKDILAQYFNKEEVDMALDEDNDLLAADPIAEIQWDEEKKICIISFSSETHPSDVARLLLTLVNNKILNIEVGENYYLGSHYIFRGEEADREYYFDSMKRTIDDCRKILYKE
jgi:hypothetical protein